MSNPSEGEVRTQLSNAVNLLQHTREYLHINADNYLNDEDVLKQSIETDFSAGLEGALASIRADLNSANGRHTELLTPLIREYGRVLGIASTDPQRIISEIYFHYIATAQFVASRQFTFGTPAADAGNNGDGVINRLTVDENGLDIENGHADAKEAQVIRDATSGASEHEEVFEFRGASAEVDQVEVTGSGASREITALSARTSQRFILNPSFSRVAGTDASPTAITGWTVDSDIANFEIDRVNFYRDFNGDTSPASVKFKANDKLFQKFQDRNARFDRGVPVYTQIAYNRSVGAADGALTIRMGTRSASVADLTLAPAGWNILRIPIGTDNWYANFNENDPDFEIELSGNTTGELLVDDVILAEYQFFDGCWYAPVGGATPWLSSVSAGTQLDLFTWTDTEVGSIIQYWLWRAFGRFLPHAIGGAVTFADP